MSETCGRDRRCPACDGQGWYYINDQDVPSDCYENCERCGGVNDFKNHHKGDRKGTGRECAGGDPVWALKGHVKYLLGHLVCPTCNLPMEAEHE